MTNALPHTGSPTLRSCINDGEKALLEAKIDTARLDAELLLCHALGQNRAFILTHFNESVAENILESYKCLIQRREKREPVAYITGEKEFYSLNFKVTKDTLIPRPETETLVDTVLKFYGTGTKINVLDIGTGTGAIAVAIVRHRPLWKITAVDISDKAIDVAQKNSKANGVDKQINFKVSDLYQSCVNKKFDIIISNPPYIPDGDKNVSPEAELYEPKRALYSGSDGLDVIERIIHEATDHLAKNGKLIFEIGDGQDMAIASLIEKEKHLKLENVVPDLKGLKRVIVATQVKVDNG